MFLNNFKKFKKLLKSHILQLGSGPLDFPFGSAKRTRFPPLGVRPHRGKSGQPSSPCSLVPKRDGTLLPFLGYSRLFSIHRGKGVRWLSFAVPKQNSEGQPSGPFLFGDSELTNWNHNPKVEGKQYSKKTIRDSSHNFFKKSKSLKTKISKTNNNFTENSKSFFLEQTLKKKSFVNFLSKNITLKKISKFKSIEYSLENFHRSNQDTCLIHRTAVTEGEWVQSGDLLADCSASVGGELALGQNIVVAYMPWEGFNYEDAILLSERLVFDDVYTSIHIERYEIEARETKTGKELITREIPDVSDKELKNLDKNGIVKLGNWVEEGDILVGKITPISQKVDQSLVLDYQKLLIKLFEKELKSVKDSSIRAPKGIKSKVIKIQVLKYKSQLEENLDKNGKKIYSKISNKLNKAKILKQTKDKSLYKSKINSSFISKKPLSLEINHSNLIKNSMNKNPFFTSKIKATKQNWSRRKINKYKNQLKQKRIHKQKSIWIFTKNSSWAFARKNLLFSWKNKKSEKKNIFLKSVKVLSNLTKQRTDISKNSLDILSLAKTNFSNSEKFFNSEFLKQIQQSNPQKFFQLFPSLNQEPSKSLITRLSKENLKDNIIKLNRDQIKKNQINSKGLLSEKKKTQIESLKQRTIRSEWMINLFSVYLDYNLKTTFLKKRSALHCNILAPSDSSKLAPDFARTRLYDKKSSSLNRFQSLFRKIPIKIITLSTASRGKESRGLSTYAQRGSMASTLWNQRENRGGSKAVRSSETPKGDTLSACPLWGSMAFPPKGDTGCPQRATVYGGGGRNSTVPKSKAPKHNMTMPKMQTQSNHVFSSSCSLKKKKKSIVKKTVIKKKKKNFINKLLYSASYFLKKNRIFSIRMKAKKHRLTHFFSSVGSSQPSKDNLEHQSKEEPLKYYALKKNLLEKKQKLKKIPTNVHIYLAEKRKIQVGDKIAGRHGNKGIISLILPRQDMPFLPDGTPIDIVLNPLGVPSRMNVGQIYECLLGLAGKYLGEQYKIFPFDEIYGPEASRSFVYSKLYEARKKTGFKWLFDPSFPGKIRIYDGRTGESFDQPITVGRSYILKLVHMVDDKIHCLTADHDVLTNQGWIPIDLVKQDHLIATLSRESELIYQKPTKLLSYPDFKGKLYCIKNSNLDLVVTPEHRMFVSNGEITGNIFEGYELIEAKKIAGKYKKYLKTANWKQPDYQFILPSCPTGTSQSLPEKIVDMEAWLCFFGILIAEGWTLMNINSTSSSTSQSIYKAVYQVQISPTKLSLIHFIEKAIKKLGFSYVISKNKINIDNQQLWSYLRNKNLKNTYNFLPKWVWLLSQTQAQILLETMCLSDDTLRETSLSYYTSSIGLADDVMRLALHAGWSANKNLQFTAETQGRVIENGKLSSNYNFWNLSILKLKNNPSVNDSHQKKQKVQEEKWIEYEGPVYCLQVPNEVFYIRRNGLPVWTGNSRSTGPYSLVTQQPLRGRSKMGGQRLGEMEVWAIEGYGAAFILLEMLTIKSDDMNARHTLWSSIIFNKEIYIGTPEAFNVLVRELQALCLDIGLFHY